MSDLGLEIREQLWDTDTHTEENARTHTPHAIKVTLLFVP